MLALDNSLVLLLNIVNKVMSERVDPRQSYIDWSTRIMIGQTVGNIASRVNADRAGIVSNVVVFRPPLDRLQTDLKLPREVCGPRTEEEERVTIVAEYEAEQLSTIAISSVRNYLVGLNFISSEWPVRYADEHSRKADRLAKHEELRPMVERFLDRTSNALDLHIKHRVPIGNVPEEAAEIQIEEGDLSLRIMNILHTAGITNYGDLGILSLNQLSKLHRIGHEAVEEIKVELARHGWLSPAYK